MRPLAPLVVARTSGHGKSVLARSLAAIDPDRLPAEARLEAELRLREAVVEGSELSLATLVPQAEAEPLLEALVATGRAVRVGPGRFAHPSALAAAKSGIVRVLETARKRDPVALGVEPGALLVGTGIEPGIFELALAALLGEGKVSSDRGFLRIAGHRPAAAPEMDRVSAAVRALLLAEPFNTPKLGEIAKQVGGAPAAVVAVVNRMTQEGELLALRDGILLHRDAMRTARELAVRLGQEKGEVNPGDFRDALKTSRKYVIPILERLEKEGVTARRGAVHVLK